MADTVRFTRKVSRGADDDDDREGAPTDAHETRIDLALSNNGIRRRGVSTSPSRSAACMRRLGDYPAAMHQFSYMGVRGSAETSSA